MRSTRKTADLVSLALLLALLGVSFLARSPYAVPVPHRDSGIFLKIGSDVLHGKVLYQQSWDNKQPLLYAINALGLWLGGGSAWGVWGLELALLTAVIVVSYRLLRPTLPVLAAFGAVCMAYLSVFPFMGGNFSEEYSLVFQIGILGVLLGMYLPNARRFSRPLAAGLIGVLAGLVFCIKQSYLDIPLTALVLMLFLAWVENDRRILGNVLLAGLGFLLVNLPVFAYFLAKGALRDYVIDAFMFNVYYSHLSVPERVTSLLEKIKFTASHPFFFVAASTWLGAIFLLALQRKALPGRGPEQTPKRLLDLTPDIGALRRLCARMDWREPGPAVLLGLGLIDLPIALLTISTSGKAWTHYYITLFPAVLLVLSGGLGCLYRYFRTSIRQAVLNGLLIAALLTGSFPPLHQVASNLIEPAGGDARSAAAAYIKKVTTPEDTILVWGWEAVIYFLSQRDAPTRFALPFALYLDTPYLNEYAGILLQEVQAHPPAFILDLRDPGMPFIDGRPAETCVSGNQMIHQRMVDFLAYVCANYQEDRSFDTINVYKRKTQSMK